MNLEKFCGKVEFSAIQFVFSLTDHIREKVKNKELIYKEQIVRYVKKQIDFFFKPFNIKISLLNTYKFEVYNSVMFKLQYILKEQNVLRCI